ncbi:hypothetical protein Tsubulata_033432 [Turnera subulata]|uniref:Cytochrome P450 n=1 Tax=Turnera subulata TaxID=218843 RepID=A0A9Q0JHM3_9ROSI|nr:hypothetical protein Tsubulata_033432 [Turnera subulata]
MEIAFLAIVLALILGLALAFLLSPFLTKEEHKNVPDGSMGWPLCGETLSFLKPHRSYSIGNFLQERCSRYGKIFKSRLFGSPAIVSCDPELNMFILQNEEKLFRASYPKPMHGILGKFSLLILSGHHHRKLRNVAINFVAMAKTSPTFLHCAEKYAVSIMESWKDRKEVAVHEEAKKFMLSLMVKSLLSIEPDQASDILQDFRTYMKGFVSLPIAFPGSSYTKAKKARERLSSTVREIIRQRGKEDMRLSKGDFLDVILSNNKLSHDEIVSIVLDILFGGYETTSTLIPLIVYFLAQEPTVLQTFKDEHETIRKSKTDGKPLDLDDYRKMEFTQNVISESMRCGNVVKFVHRRALQDVKYKEYIIPSGWLVLPIFTAAHFDESLHDNPFKFDPWRWNVSSIRSFNDILILFFGLPFWDFAFTGCTPNG